MSISHVRLSFRDRQCLLRGSNLLRESVLAICLGVLLLSASSTARLQAEDNLSKLAEAEVEELRERIRETSKLPGSEDVASLVDSPLILWVDRCFIGSTDVYSGAGFRYVVLRVSLGNTTKEDIVLQRDQISLVTETRTFQVGQTASRRLRSSPLEIDWTPEQHPRPQTLLETPKKLTARAGKAISFWTVFFELDPLPVVPKMTLKIHPDGQAEQTLDLNAQQNARLGLSELRLGPKLCQLVLTIHGQLNRVNSVKLAERITEAHRTGVERFLITWAPTAKPSDEVLFTWLLSPMVAQREENPLLTQLPALPNARQVAIARVPEGNEEALQWSPYQLNRYMYASAEEATSALLQDVFTRLDQAALLQEIRDGHPWSRQAAIQTAGHQLSPSAYPILKALSQQNDPGLRRDVFLAMGFQPAAVEELVTLSKSTNADEAALGLEALCMNASGSRPQLISDLLMSTSLSIPVTRTLQILTAHYHPAWNEFLLRSAKDNDPSVRHAALKALLEVGHPRLDSLCIDALQDGDVEVRKVAFTGLANSPNVQSRRAALNFTLEQLKNGHISEEGLSLIELSRETQAAPLLIALLNSTEVPRFRLLEVIGEIGTDQHCQQTLDLLPEFTDEEKLSAIDLATRLPAAAQLKIARSLTASENQSVRQSAIGILRQLGDEESVSILAQMLSTADGDALNDLIYALGEIGTPPAVKELRSFRIKAYEEKHEMKMRFADAGIQEWKNRLPGWKFVENGNLHAASNDFDSALSAYTLAVRISPDLPDAYSMRGNIYLRKDKFDEAGRDFKKAFELDPYDSQAVSGVAIVQAIHGEWKEAVAFAKERADLFPHDRVYPYNLACVYSRAIETIRKQMPGLEEQQTILELEGDAIAGLKKAISQGFRDFSWMQKDPDLAAIRELPAFKQLIKEE